MNSVHQGKVISVDGNNQLVIDTQATVAQPQPGQTLIRRPLTAEHGGQVMNSQGEMVTKVIIQRPGAASQGTSLVHRPGVSQDQPPTKTITLSQGGIVSPQKAPTTPTKQIIPSGKLPISTIKSPTRYVLTAGGSGQSTSNVITSSGQMIMITRPPGQNLNSSNNVTLNKLSTITLSPPKVRIKAPTQNSTNAVQQGQRVIGSHSLASGGQTVQPLSVEGSKFQYVRLVSTQGSQQAGGATKLIGSQSAAATRSLVPVSNSSGPMKITLPQQQQQALTPQQMTRIRSAPVHQSGAFGPSNPRLILPATTQPIPIQPQPAPGMGGLRQPLSQQSLGSSLAPGTTINVVGGGMQGFAIVPAQYVTQLQQQQQQPASQKLEDSSYLPMTSGNLNQHQSSVSKLSTNGLGSSSDPGNSRPRKPCNCTKSQCLKLYCDCFANGEFCNNCNCVNCFNNLEHEEERSRSIKTCLERNPTAFHPKIGKSKGGSGNVRRHTKGCNCKRSGCLKNYCECYEAKILCSSLCKCVGCKNFEESPDRKTLMHLADAAEVRVQQQTAAKSKMEELPVKHHMTPAGERLAHTFVTSEVVEAACACLLAQAEETERTRQVDILQERLILEEFGRCLMQVIQSSNRTKAPSPV